MGARKNPPKKALAVNRTLKAVRQVDGLTPEQERFCILYAKTGNASASYKQAFPNTKMTGGILANEARRLIMHQHIKERITALTQEAVAQARSGSIMDIAEMQARLTDIIRRLETDDYMRKDGTIGERRAAIKDALKAMELLGRMKGAFIDRTQLDINGAIPVVIKDDL